MECVCINAPFLITGVLRLGDRRVRAFMNPARRRGLDRRQPAPRPRTVALLDGRRGRPRGRTSDTNSVGFEANGEDCLKGQRFRRGAAGGDSRAGERRDCTKEMEWLRNSPPRRRRAPDRLRPRHPSTADRRAQGAGKDAEPFAGNCSSFRGPGVAPKAERRRRARFERKQCFRVPGGNRMRLVVDYWKPASACGADSAALQLVPACPCRFISR